MRHRALLLNSGYQPIASIGWKRAIILQLLEKVDILEKYDEIISSPSMDFNVPAVMRLKDNVQASPLKLRYSRTNVYKRDQKTCQYCGNQFKTNQLTLDHVIPKSIGGKTTWTNIVACCKRCNTKKANRTPQQANMRLIKRPSYPNMRLMYSSDAGTNIPNEWSKWLPY